MGFADGRDGERPLSGARAAGEELTGAGRDTTDRGAAEAEGKGDDERGLSGALDPPECPKAQEAGPGEAEHPMLTKLRGLVQVRVVRVRGAGRVGRAERGDGLHLPAAVVYCERVKPRT